jgi:Chromosome segregation ATPases
MSDHNTDSNVGNLHAFGTSESATAVLQATAGRVAGLRITSPRTQFDWDWKDILPGSATIGSSPDCDIYLPVPGVAPRHCVLIVGTQRTLLQALSPRTWINDGVATESHLKPGDRLIVGPVELHISAIPAREPVRPQAQPISPQHLQELLASSQSITRLASPSPGKSEPPPRSPQPAAEQILSAREDLLDELLAEIQSSLDQVLQREKDHRKEAARDRLVLQQRARELDGQFAHLEEMRAKIQKEKEQLAAAEELARQNELRSQELRQLEAILNERHEELGLRTRSLVETHRKLRAEKELLHEQKALLASVPPEEEVNALKSTLARSKAQLCYLENLEQELIRRDEQLQNEIVKLAEENAQLTLSARKLEEEKRDWTEKCREREKFLEQFESGLNSRQETLDSTERDLISMRTELSSTQQALEHLKQELDARTEALNQNTQDLEQRNLQIAELQDRLNAEKAEIEASRREIEATRSEQAARAAELDAKNEELSLREEQLRQREETLNAREQEIRNLEEKKFADLQLREQELEQSREQLQKELSEIDAERQNFQRLRAELEAERQRDAYDREQMQIRIKQLEVQQAEIDHRHQMLEEARRELKQQQDEWTTTRESSVPAALLGTQSNDSEELELQRQQLAEDRRLLAEAREELDLMRDALGRREAEVNAAAERVQKEQESLHILQHQIQEGRERFEEQDRELTRRREELESERREFEQAREELEVRLRQLDQREEQLLEREQALESQASLASLNQIDTHQIEGPSDSDPEITPTDSEVHQEYSSAETSVPEPEDETAVRLRAELASLFGMSFSKPSETFQEEISPELRPDDVAESRDDSAQESIDCRESHVPEENDASVEVLRFEAPISSRDDAAAQPEAPPQTTGGFSSSPDNEDDEISVEAYMERLLARTRSRDQGAPVQFTPRQESAITPAVSQPLTQLQTASPSEDSTSAQPDPEQQKAPAPRKRKLDELERTAIRENLHSFRQVANQSARIAVAKSKFEKKSTLLRNMVIINLIGWLATLGLLAAATLLHRDISMEVLIVGSISGFLTILCIARYKEIRRLDLKRAAPPLNAEGEKKKPDPEEADPAPKGPLSFL